MNPANLDSFEFRLARHGSMSDIYLARHQAAMSYDYVLKIMQKRYCEETALRHRFYQESDMLCNLQHLLAPRIFYRGAVQGRPYIIYKYIPGEALSDYLQSDANRDGLQTHAIFTQLLELLHHLHTHTETIVHSDISPHNLIIDDDNKLHIIDFGCAQHISHHHLANTWIGKRRYLSPEQAQGKAWDHRSDLYQAGLIFYELLTGLPYLCAKDHATLAAVAVNPPQFKLDTIKRKHRKFLIPLLNPDPSLRYQTARECLQAFSRLL